MSAPKTSFTNHLSSLSTSLPLVWADCCGLCPTDEPLYSGVSWELRLPLPPDHCWPDPHFPHWDYSHSSFLACASLSSKMSRSLTATTTTNKATLLRRYPYFLKHSTNKRSRFVFSEHAAIDDNLDDLHWCSTVESLQNLLCHLHDGIVRLQICSFQWESERGNKATQPANHTASVLFYFPDGFRGLTPEYPLLPSLSTCSRLPLLATGSAGWQLSISGSLNRILLGQLLISTSNL